MAGRTGYPLRRSRLPLPGVSPCRPQRQPTANRDWNRSRKDEGPCGGTPGGERSPVFSGLSSPPAGSEGRQGLPLPSARAPWGCRDPRERCPPLPSLQPLGNAGRGGRGPGAL